MGRPDDKLRVNLEARPDQYGKIYHIGRIKFPGMIDCTNGVVFLVFTSEEGSEELQIAPMEAKEQTGERTKRPWKPRDGGPRDGGPPPAQGSGERDPQGR